MGVCDLHFDICDPYRCDDGESEPEKILRHLLGPKKSSAGLSRNKDIITLKAKRTNENIVVRCVSVPIVRTKWSFSLIIFGGLCLYINYYL